MACVVGYTTLSAATASAAAAAAAAAAAVCCHGFSKVGLPDARQIITAK